MLSVHHKKILLFTHFILILAENTVIAAHEDYVLRLIG